MAKRTLAPVQWWNSKSPVFRFLSLFGLLMLLFYLFYYSFLYEDYIMKPLLRGQANVANGLLNLLGFETYAVEDIIASADRRYSVSIKGGCDGVEATALFLCALLAFPLSFRWKWQGIVAGLIALFILNIIRIAGLYLAGVYWPAGFEFLHLHGGVVIFTIIAVILWIIWINWAMRQKAKADETA